MISMGTGVYSLRPWSTDRFAFGQRSGAVVALPPATLYSRCMRVPLRTSTFYRTPLRTPLAVVAWLGMLLHLGASVCGTLACAGQMGQMMGAAGLACCPGQHAREADDAAPAHTVKRAPCGCCDTQAACTVAPLGPVLEVAPSRAPAPVAVTVPPPALLARPGQRVASLPWRARPPPVLPSPTRTIVFLI